MSRYTSAEQYVFATDSPRAGENRGRQPICLATVMRHYIQPAAKRVGITKRIGWHTFRRTYSSLLHKNGEVVKVVQELLRHGSSKVTMDVYAQAVTSAKRNAQQKVVSILREKEPGTLRVPDVSPANFTGSPKLLKRFGVPDGI